MYVTAHRTGRKGRSHRLPRPGRSLVSGTTRRAGDHHRAHHPMAGIVFMAGEWAYSSRAPSHRLRDAIRHFALTVA